MAGPVSGVPCWYHTTYVPAEGGDGWKVGELVAHDYSPAEVVRLLELFSGGDWEDGPRCLRRGLDDDDDGKPLEPRRWIP